jgi:hypothetical protein
LLERLLELFFHAKSGVFAGILLIGTTGALVTATVSNGVTTITITQASASPSASASASPSATASPTASPTTSPTASPSASPTASASPSDGSGSANGCSAQAHAMADAVKTVDSAFSHFHADLTKMRTDNKSAKSIVENADKQLKDLRQNAVKAIHATNTCASGKDDEDKDNEDENDDDDNKTSQNGNFIVVLFSNLQSFFGGHHKDQTKSTTLTTLTVSPNASTSPSPVASGDPKTIADNAVAAMQLVFDDAKAQLAALPTPSPRATRSPNPKGTAKADDHHGKSERGDRSDDDREDEDD